MIEGIYVALPGSVRVSLNSRHVLLIYVFSHCSVTSLMTGRDGYKTIKGLEHVRQ